MFINELYLKNFRNYDELKIPFQEKVNIVLGKNGQGKTNLLEGIYILSMGKSFRTNKDTEMINFTEDYFRVIGEFTKEDRRLFVEMDLSKTEKMFKIDGVEKRKNADLLENVYTVIFSPEDLKTIKDEPDKRRKFIDRQLFQLKPLYYKDLARYKKVLKNRNSTLKEEKINQGLLDVWDEYLVETGSKIMMERKNLILKLNEISAEINNKITDGKEELRIEYEPHIDSKEDLEEQKEEIRKRISESRAADIDRRTTTTGIHRDDIKITIDGIDTRKFGSQGQQRTAALALKLAELKIIKEETGEDAILLLDDVLSELDIDRQNFLINSFKDNQIFISAAEISENVMSKLNNSKIYRVNNGDILF
jgi:DNA replication and repair protein RecF